MKIEKDLVIRSIAGECVAIPTGKAAMKANGLISLTPSGELLVRKLMEGCELEDLVTCLLERYDVERDQACRDVELFLEKLKELGLL